MQTIGFITNWLGRDIASLVDAYIAPPLGAKVIWQDDLGPERDLPIACLCGHYERARLLAQNREHVQYTPRALILACDAGYAETMRMLVCGSICIPTDCWGWAMYHTCKNGHLDCVKEIANRARQVVSWGFSGACEGGHADVFNYLLTWEAPDWAQCTRYARKGGHVAMIERVALKT